MIRAIFLDLDDTLIALNTLLIRCVVEFLARHPDFSTPRWRQRCLKGLPADLAPQARINRSFVTSYLVGAPDQLGMSRGQIAEELDEVLPHMVESNPNVLAMIADLSRQHRTAIVTNGSSRTQSAKLRGSGLKDVVDRIFISGEVGLRKPSIRLFEHVLEWAQVAPDEAIMVGDDEDEDIVGAKDTGLRTCLITGSPNHSSLIADFEIQSVLELPTILERPR